MATQTPFLMVSTRYYLEYLHSLGFKTFGNIIDESYDLEHNIEKRFDMICAEIDRLAQLSPSEKKSLVDKLYQVAEYNKVNYKEITNRYVYKNI